MLQKVESKEYQTSWLVYSRDVYVEHVHGERLGKNQLDETSHSSQPIREVQSRTLANSSAAVSADLANLRAACSADATKLQQ